MLIAIRSQVALAVVPAISEVDTNEGHDILRHKNSYTMMVISHVDVQDMMAIEH